MVKKYYCDYCDRSLTDNAENRKKHLEGTQHQINVKLHYDLYKDDGYCPYGLSCKYSHVPKGIDFTFIDPYYYLALNPHILQSNKFTTQEQWKQPTVQTFKYKLPPGLTKDLPSSLRPPPPTGYDFFNAAQWESQSPKETNLREDLPPDPDITPGDVGPYGDGARRVKVKSKTGDETEGYIMAGGNEEDKPGTGGRGRRGKGGRNLRGPGVGGWLYETQKEK
ncbi:13028_t:CDS:2 [Funneliformis mosseae]|uniref:13028_t:CDS:1 n=1 Tax=Funneliformis mosseae TaxID=27381 RepID=A0A9N8ZYB7_FUNMO|nr:13028_t:CDS:2 [Funneliformis mosseae]